MNQKKVRYAVVGTGWFAQDAILPAFRNAAKNSELVAVVSDDSVKQKALSERYGIPAHKYEQYDALRIRFRGAIQMHLTDHKGETKTTAFEERDQVGPEIEYFSDCVLNDREPEPSGLEGLTDLCVIDAVNEACDTGRVIKLPPFAPKPRPSRVQEYQMPKVGAPELVNAASPGG